jgi:15-cis-phytoene synthase
MIAVADAYAECSRITASQAKNFAYGIKLLDRPRRDAMSAIYALARRIDDIGDGDLPIDRKREALDLVRKQLGDLGGAEDDAVLVALADTHARYRLPLDEFELLVEGCELDVDGVGCASFADLAGYCRRVAGSIGRLSLAVFGTDYPESAEPRAEALGVALQVTNILRDVVEDRGMGRVYLPREEAAAMGCAADLSGPPEAVAALVEAQIPRVEQYFDRGLELLPLLDRRSRACVAAMAGIYHRLLARIADEPVRVLRERVSLPTHEKAWVAARSISVGRA